MEIKTHDQVRNEFRARGLSISGWAKRHGFSQALVYQVLSGKRKPTRGESHRIAVALGLKDGSNEGYEQLDNSLFTRAGAMNGQIDNGAQ